MAHKPDEPLTLTVHNMPSFDANSAEAVAKTRRGRWMMLEISFPKGTAAFCFHRFR